MKKNIPYIFYNSLLELARKCDYLMLCCSDNKETYQLVNKEILTALDQDGSLINVSRGSVIDESALFYALENKLIRGAALDVSENELNKPEPYLDLPNLILSPHMRARTHNNMTKMFEELAKIINNDL